MLQLVPGGTGASSPQEPAPEPASSDAARLGDGALLPAPRAAEQQQLLLQRQQLRDIIRDEVSSSLATAQPPSQPPMQLIINNTAEANTQQHTINAPAAWPGRGEDPKGTGPMAPFSPLSRLCIFTA